MREPKISFRRASRPATSPWRTILGGAALATTQKATAFAADLRK